MLLIKLSLAYHPLADTRPSLVPRLIPFLEKEPGTDCLRMLYLPHFSWAIGYSRGTSVTRWSFLWRVIDVQQALHCLLALLHTRKRQGIRVRAF